MAPRQPIVADPVRHYQSPLAPVAPVPLLRAPRPAHGLTFVTQSPLNPALVASGTLFATPSIAVGGPFDFSFLALSVPLDPGFLALGTIGQASFGATPPALGIGTAIPALVAIGLRSRAIATAAALSIALAAAMALLRLLAAALAATLIFFCNDRQ